nr:hypothetical protein [Paraburkholderia sp. BL8N3]
MLVASQLHCKLLHFSQVCGVWRPVLEALLPDRQKEPEPAQVTLIDDVESQLADFVTDFGMQSAIHVS